MSTPITHPLTAYYAAMRNSMSPANRLSLIQRVLEKAYDEVETWNDDHLGSALAYLALAIADGKPDSFVDWSDENGNPATRVARELFRQWFPGDDMVWLFIVT